MCVCVLEGYSLSRVFLRSPLSIFLLSFLRRTFGENRFSSLTSFPFLLYTRALSLARSLSLLLPFSILLTLSFFFDRKEKSYTLKPRAAKFRREKGEKFLNFSTNSRTRTNFLHARSSCVFLQHCPESCAARKRSRTWPVEFSPTPS